MGLRFEHPQWPALLLLAPLLAGFLGWRQWRKRRLLARFADVELLGRLLPSVSRAKQLAKDGLLLAGFTLAAFCLARPQYGAVERRVERKGVDLFIAIDTSASMLSKDIPPDRLTRAKEQLKGLIHKLKGDRVGIIAFAGAAFVQCPLTLDYGLAERILDTVGPDTVPVPGTAIGDAIEVATRNFEQNELGHKALVLLTDGEDQGSNPVNGAQEAAKDGVIIYAVGIGSEQGAPIPLSTGGYKEDKEGHKVNSKLDFETLKKIAQATGGSAILGLESGFKEIDAIYEDMQSIEKKRLESLTHSLFRDRYQYFLLPAIMLLTLEMLMGDRKRRPKAAARTESMAGGES
ncbi:MAG: VWA domain-containing protein [Candidatus Sumerlaeota bacterium]|nr:VWA domain-containing protein [Candidatus Sumerlaeota bacterium]